MVPRSRSLLLPPPTPPVLRRHLLASRRAALRGARLLSTATQHKVVDIAGASDTKGMSEQGSILLVEKHLQFKPLERPAGAEIVVPAGAELFASSDDPLAHTAADVGKYFQFEPSVVADLFYHTGFCGPDTTQRKLKTTATMVRSCSLALRDELLSLEAKGELGQVPGLVVSGARGAGKSTLLNYAAAACHQAGWLVVSIPQATDWTLGLGGRSCQVPNQASNPTLTLSLSLALTPALTQTLARTPTPTPTPDPYPGQAPNQAYRRAGLTPTPTPTPNPDQAPNQAYRCADRDYFSELPLELQPQRAGSEVILSNLPHAYDETTGEAVPNHEALQAFLRGEEAAVHWLPPREGFGYQAAQP